MEAAPFGHRRCFPVGVEHADDLYDDGYDNYDGEHDVASTSSDDIDSYLQAIQGNSGGAASWKCHPHDPGQQPCENDGGAAAAPVDMDVSGDLPAEGQASAGGDLSAAAATGRTAACTTAAATAGVVNMDRLRDRDPNHSRAEGYDDPAMNARKRSGSDGGGMSAPGYGEEDEAGPQAAQDSDAGGDGLGVAAMNADGGGGRTEDKPLWAHQWHLQGKAKAKTRSRRRPQTARKAAPSYVLLPHEACHRCGGGNSSSGCGCSKAANKAADGTCPAPTASAGGSPWAASEYDGDGCRDTAPIAKRQRIDSVAAERGSCGGGGIMRSGGGAQREAELSDSDSDFTAGAVAMAAATGMDAETEPDPAELRTLPEDGGWGEQTPGATELLRQVAKQLRLHVPQCLPDLYIVEGGGEGGGGGRLRVMSLKKKHPALAEAVEQWHIPRRMALQDVSDPCHPVYNNDMALRRMEPKHRMLVFTEQLPPNKPLSAYFGTLKTQLENDEYVLADATGARQLMESYTHDVTWMQHRDDSEKLVVVGDNRRCLMTYANEIRVWGTCEEMWRGVPSLEEDVRRTGCRCAAYSGRTANAHCVQGIAKTKDSRGEISYSLFILYYTKRAVEKGEEVLLNWDSTGTFFNAIREAVNTVRFYQRIQARLHARGMRLAKQAAALAAAEREKARLGELVRQRDAETAWLQCELAALRTWSGPPLGNATSTGTAAESADAATPRPPQPLPLPLPELSHKRLLCELYELRSEVSALRAEGKADLLAASLAESKSREVEQLRRELEDERAERQDVEVQLAACRANSNLQRVQLVECRRQLDVCARQLKRLKEELAGAKAEAAAAAGAVKAAASTAARRVQRSSRGPATGKGAEVARGRGRGSSGPLSPPPGRRGPTAMAAAAVIAAAAKSCTTGPKATAEAPVEEGQPRKDGPDGRGVAEPDARVDMLKRGSGLRASVQPGGDGSAAAAAAAATAELAPTIGADGSKDSGVRVFGGGFIQREEAAAELPMPPPPQPPPPPPPPPLPPLPPLPPHGGVPARRRAATTAAAGDVVDLTGDGDDEA